MPSYTYLCPDHGGFAAHRPVAEYAAASPCPVCGTACNRQMALPMKAAAPAAPQAAAPARSHAAGCGCCSPNRRRSPTASAAVTAATRPGTPGGLFAGI